ncbi:MAG: Asp-tRNA(Asn)/Glu-tRNA(Gln) amidotransferase subunit GatB [Pseudomonadota bacterium]
MSSAWESVIGLEVHVQLSTRSKIFCGASIAYGAEPNTQACDVSIALPGVLPVMNAEAARLAVKFGLAIGAEINQRSIFARKNYFYPDLPKGYQISQFELPIVGLGSMDIDIDGKPKTIGITRAHLEDDAGKSLHEDFHGSTGIDLNRAGTPLLEIVSEPDMRSASEAVAYLRALHSLVRYLEISDGNMQEGSFRCDANVSVRRANDTELGTRAELKNINSFRFVEKAINFEIERQIELIEDGGEVVQETRLYDSDKDETRSMRSKEEAHDYRYFPDPDLPPLILSDELVEEIRSSLPELPAARLERFVHELSLSNEDAVKITQDKDTADYFEALVDSGTEAKIAANWVLGDLAAALNASDCEIGVSPVSPLQLSQMLSRISDGTISGKIAKEVFNAMWNGEGDADDIIESRGLRQISDSGELEKIVDEILSNSEQQVQQFKDGNEKVLGFFVGQIMKATQGKANPQQVNEILRKKLD